MTAGKRILVTGGGGWIGRSVIDQLRQRGFDVQTSSRTTPAEQLAELAASASVVVHAASGYSNARADFIEGGLAHAVAVAQGCARASNAVVFLSSAKVYGWAACDSQERICDEDSPCLGTDNFSVAKKLAEDILAHAADTCVVLRISNVYGEVIPSKYAIGTMLMSALREGRITLDCNGDSRRDFVRYQDVVTAVVAAAVAAAESPRCGHRTYNIASGRLVSLREVAAIVAQAAGAQVESRNKAPVSAPAVSNRRAIDAGLIADFADPIDGIRALMKSWKERPWQPA